MFKTIAFLILFFGGLILFTLFEQNSDIEDVKGEKNLILGYCETFERYALDLSERNNLEAKKLGSSFEVLSDLKSGKIDYGVIGRRAYSYEINENTLEIPLEDLGWTLIAPYKGIILYSDLEGLEIHTYLDEKEVKEFFPFETNLRFHENIEDALEGEYILIHWEDFTDDLELLIPIENDKKVEKFRTPLLYMNDSTQSLELK